MIGQIEHTMDCRTAPHILRLNYIQLLCGHQSAEYTALVCLYVKDTERLNLFVLCWCVFLLD